ncbi:MAG: DUF4190 domain-containing protein [Microbacteriaceae bacterium]|nr:DUF4190 domain-containing protein [Microbacteriaceae bacterium]
MAAKQTDPIGGFRRLVRWLGVVLILVTLVLSFLWSILEGWGLEGGFTWLISEFGWPALVTLIGGLVLVIGSSLLPPAGLRVLALVIGILVGAAVVIGFVIALTLAGLEYMVYYPADWVWWLLIVASAAWLIVAAVRSPALRAALAATRAAAEAERAAADAARLTQGAEADLAARAAEIKKWEDAYRLAHDGEAPPPGFLPPAAAAPTTSAGPGHTNVLAVLALVFAIGAGVVGAILGHVALAQIRRTGENGRGLALAGVIVGWISLGLTVVIGIVYAVMIGSLLG